MVTFSFFFFFDIAAGISYVLLCVFNCSFHLALKEVFGPPIGFNDICDCLQVKTLLVAVISTISVTGCHPPCRYQCALQRF